MYTKQALSFFWSFLTRHCVCQSRFYSECVNDPPLNVAWPFKGVKLRTIALQHLETLHLSPVQELTTPHWAQFFCVCESSHLCSRKKKHFKLTLINFDLVCLFILTGSLVICMWQSWWGSALSATVPQCYITNYVNSIVRTGWRGPCSTCLRVTGFRAPPHGLSRLHLRCHLYQLPSGSSLSTRRMSDPGIVS